MKLLKKELRLALHPTAILFLALSAMLMIIACSSIFTTLEENAAEIISFIDRRFGGAVLLIGGLSLGAWRYLEPDEVDALVQSAR